MCSTSWTILGAATIRIFFTFNRMYFYVRNIASIIFKCLCIDNILDRSTLCGTAGNREAIGHLTSGIPNVATGVVKQDKCKPPMLLNKTFDESHLNLDIVELKECKILLG